MRSADGDTVANTLWRIHVRIVSYVLASVNLGQDVLHIIAAYNLVGYKQSGIYVLKKTNRLVFKCLKAKKKKRKKQDKNKPAKLINRTTGYWAHITRIK